jgi:hypothetical protein
MTAIIGRDSYGPSAFIRSDSGTQIVMSGSAPCVEWSFRIKELENWLTTLEEAMVNESNYGQRRGLEDIYFSLKAAHVKHKKQHQEVLTDAPTADDLMAYLSSLHFCNDKMIIACWAVAAAAALFFNYAIHAWRFYDHD